MASGERVVAILDLECVSAEVVMEDGRLDVEPVREIAGVGNGVEMEG